jgi:CRISPR-associated endoribonuclease Cas6
MPSLWRLPSAETSTMDVRAVHKLVSRWLDVDHHAKRKPWSWTMTTEGLEIGLLDDELAGRLARYGGRSLSQVDSVSWRQLAGRHNRREWTVEFVSPVTFRRGNKLLPWPSASAVLGSLRLDWRLFAAAHVGDVAVDLSLDPVVVMAFRGGSEVHEFVLHNRRDGAGELQPVSAKAGGFLGQVTYAVDGQIDPACVDALFRLARFSGIGAHTTRGFGGSRLHDAAPA